ncbi:MAG: hypothetical protein U5K79_18960 [Cyclobacteriaceae bacterium]|nr:hypothetical protein [Cyclobacteriaceae bacterium]
MNKVFTNVKFLTLAICCLLTNLLCAVPAYSQDGYAIRNLSDLANEIQWNKKTGNTAKTIAGSPYLHDDFQEGVVYFDRKYKVDHVPMRLNLHSGEMEFMSKSTVLVIANPAKVDKDCHWAGGVYIPGKSAENPGIWICKAME